MGDVDGLKVAYVTIQPHRGLSNIKIYENNLGIEKAINRLKKKMCQMIALAAKISYAASKRNERGTNIISINVCPAPPS